MPPCRGPLVVFGFPRVLLLRTLVPVVAVLAALSSAVTAQTPPPNNVTYFTDPAATVTSSPKPDGTVETVLHKELSGYPNYGVADGRSDILYTGEVATWHFTLPTSIDPSTIRTSFFRASLIADDHYGVDLGAYRLASWVNAQYSGEGLANLPHGSPYGSRFSNWVQRDYPIGINVAAPTITLFNTSGVGNWFAVDWIELHVITGSAQTGRPQVLGISQSKGGNQGNVTVIVNGINFPQQSGPVSMRLTAAGKPTIAGLHTEQVSSNQILAAFDLRSAPPGQRDLTVTLSDGSSVLANGVFEVVNGGGSVMAVRLIGPSVARVNRDTTFIAVLENVGLNDAGLVSLQADVGAAATATPKATTLATLVAAGVLNSVIGGLAPGASIGSSFISRFQNCSNVNLSSQDQPDVCAELCAELQRLIDEENALHVQITLLEAKIAFIQSQIDSCKCESLAPVCGLASCAALLVQRAWLQNELANHRQSLAEILRRKKAIQARIEEEGCDCGPSVSSSTTLSRSSLTATTAAASASASTQATICPVFSWDPNDKTGPMGAGPAKYIPYGSELPYTVFFENKAAATAPAQDVVITDNLESSLDWSRVTLGTIKFGTQVVQPPDGVQNFTTSVDLRPAQNLRVDINASVNPFTGVLTCGFTSIDPTTGKPPTDPLVGFLPPNKIPPQGEGSISYSAALKSSVPTGTTVTNHARIVFDTNPPIDTPVWSNIVDKSAPTTNVLSLPQNQANTTFTVQWQGTDSGSGIRDYTVYVSDNGKPYLPWLVQTTATQGAYTGQLGHIYSFYSVARDLVGNEEAAKSSPDTLTNVGQPSCAADITSQFNIVRSGFRLNNANGRFVQTVSLTSKGALPLALPVYLILDKLSPSASLFSKSGSTICAPPLGDPFVSAGASNATLQPGGSLNVILEFLNPTNSGITYDARVLTSGGVK